MTFKYIIVNTGAILFNESTVHSMVGEGFKKRKEKIFAAGFCNINITPLTSVVRCYGESESLKIKSQPQRDEQIIRDLFAPVSQIKYFGFNVTEFYEK